MPAHLAAPQLGGRAPWRVEMHEASGQSILRSKTRPPTLRALPRARLSRLLEGLWDHRLGLVVAPAGSGKTTLLAQLASTAPGPVGWYRAEPADASVGSLVAHLGAALAPGLGVAGRWRSVEDVLKALEAVRPSGAVLVVDELDALWGTEAEAALERIVTHMPAGIALLAATRRIPSFDLSRMRVSNALIEVGPDDLRFRAWEVEDLFRDFYGEPLPPEDMAELARRTEGWAAGLQLFHLATRGKSAPHRRRLLHELGLRSRLVREYLTRNVLDGLEPEMRGFLLQTCVLSRLDGPLCDHLTGSSGGELMLSQLEQRQIFTHALDAEGGTYRYHEVLRSHLEALLVEQEGEEAVRARHQRAGALLESAGAAADAVRSYCRAEDWDSAMRVLGGRGDEVIGERGLGGQEGWIDALPSSLLDQDPWLSLATARRHVADGRLDVASDCYSRAEAGFGPGAPGAVCRRERLALGVWLEPVLVAPSDWTGVLRAASQRDPLGATAGAMGPTPAATELMAGLGSLLAGAVRDAEHRLAQVAEDVTASAVVAAAAETAAAIAAALGGRPVLARLDAAAESASVSGVPWLARVARAARVLDATVDQHEDVLVTTKDDAWGSALANLFGGLASLRRDQPRFDLIDQAEHGFGALGAGTLQAWARAAAALGHVRVGSPSAPALATSAHAFARTNSVPGAAALASGAIAGLRKEGRNAVVTDAFLSRGSELGIHVAALFPTDARPPRRGEPPWLGLVDRRGSGEPGTRGGCVVRCFGGFTIRLHGTQVDLHAVKPRARSLLRYLGLYTGEAVHKERLVSALWPDEADDRAGTRNLQVAISSLRQLLEPGVARGEAAVLVRDGDMYRLVLGAGADVDVQAFDAAVAEARALRVGGGLRAAEPALRRALDAYAGSLLPEEGSAEWVLEERERRRLLAADAAHALASLAVERGEPAAAAELAERGLRLDRYRDGLWQLLVAELEASGQAARASRTRQQYHDVLTELGLGLSPSG